MHQCLSAVVTYKLAIDGDDSFDHFLSAGGVVPANPDPVFGNFHVLGVYNLEVWVKVTDNELVPDSDLYGGLLQSAFDLSDTTNAIHWEDYCSTGVACYLPMPPGVWGSEAHPDFDIHFKGTRADQATDVIAETGAIAPGDYTAQFGDIGANEWTLVSSGRFAYDGTPTTLQLKVANPYGGDIVVAHLEGASIVGGIPDLVIVDSLRINIPEPSSMLQAILVGIVMLQRRRRCSPAVVCTPAVGNELKLSCVRRETLRGLSRDPLDW